MAKYLPFVMLLLLCAPGLRAQDFLGNDLTFFEKKAEQYQRWLDAKGLGRFLAYDKLELKMNGHELELWLAMNTTDPDTAAVMWESLEQGFRSANPGENLEEALFEAFARKMEIPPAQGNVQVYVPSSTGTGYDPCFYVWIWEEHGKVTHESRTRFCRAKPIEIEISPPKVKKVSKKVESRISGKEDAKVVFDKILQYAHQRYERKACENRNPRPGEDQVRDYTLTFAVNDLCREVLKDEKKSGWCWVVEKLWGPCNDMRRERLEFKFTYIPTPEGYRLDGTVTGKFGSGVFIPRTSGYMDMDPDFEEDYLAPYTIEFQKDLKAYLER